MKKRRNSIIISAVLVIAIAAFVVMRIGSKTSTFKQNYHIEDINSVTKVYLSVQTCGASSHQRKVQLF